MVCMAGLAGLGDWLISPDYATQSSQGTNPAYRLPVCKSPQYPPDVFGNEVAILSLIGARDLSS